MQTTAQILLILHITAGLIALITGLLAIGSRKGGVLHRRSGRTFHACMVTVALTSVALSGMKGNAFLFHIGLFALYQVHGGLRSVRNKALVPTTQDWAMLAIGGFNGCFLVATLNPVLLVFGGISMMLALQDLASFVRTARGEKLPDGSWLRRHIGMMMGTYIATTTAFLLTAFRSYDLGIVIWLAPTAIGVPFIFMATRRAMGRLPTRS